MSGRRKSPFRGEDYYSEDRSRRKLPEPTVCEKCGAVYREGRWTWAEPVTDAYEILCPACARAEHGLPAGTVSVGGEFARKHIDEITSLIRNIEAREREEHPLKRIIDIESDSNELLISTTDMRLARQLGEALHHAYSGELEAQFVEDSNVLRVHWQRDR